MSSTQLQLALFALAPLAYAVFRARALHGSRPRATRHLLGALAAFACVAAPTLAWQGPDMASATHVGRSFTVLVCALSALALWTALFRRRTTAPALAAAPALPPTVGERGTVLRDAGARPHEVEHFLDDIQASWPVPERSPKTVSAHAGGRPTRTERPEARRDETAAELHALRDALRVQRAATARAMRIAREAVAALAAIERAAPPTSPTPGGVGPRMNGH